MPYRDFFCPTDENYVKISPDNNNWTTNKQNAAKYITCLLKKTTGFKERWCFYVLKDHNLDYNKDNYIN